MQSTSRVPLSLVALSLALLVTVTADASPRPRKVFADAGVVPDGPGVKRLADYGVYSLYRLSPAALRNLPPSTRDRLIPAGDMDRIGIDAHPWNPLTERLSLPAGFEAPPPRGLALQLIQFVGPIRETWLVELRAVDVEPIHAVRGNAYLVWTGDVGRQALAARVAEGRILQLSTPFHPGFKLGPTLRERLLAGPADPHSILPVVVQMLRHAGSSETEELIAARATGFDSPWTPVLRYQNRWLSLRLRDVLELARRQDVTWIGERLPRELADEVQAQIVAGNLDVDRSGPDAPGYLAFLDTLGFSRDPADYPVLDVADDGIGNGTASSGDPTFHVEGDLANPSRLLAVDNCTARGDGGGPSGHGHLAMSIAGGYDERDGFPYRDADGYQRALGVNPHARLSGTRIFAGFSFDVSGCGGTDTSLIRQISLGGAGISSNSWGCSGCSGIYDDSSQAFDVGTRDADPLAAGNQQLLFVFSSGNEGPGAVSVRTPGNAKNVLTVGAVENDRPGYLDGCGFGPEDADDAMDLAAYSSRGPAPGQRVKPDLVVPGTHVQGTASTHPTYNGASLCDVYRPAGQLELTSSTGTSFACPAVSGLASLAWWWLENRETGLGGPPSPALLKAFLIAHTSWVTGDGAGDDLPSTSQGYGLPDMNRLFDDGSERILVDQGEILGDSGESYDLFAVVDDPMKPVRIALAYTDEAGLIGTSPQVNDLDLTVQAGGATYLGNVLDGAASVPGGTADRANNVEVVFLPPGQSGILDVSVRAWNLAGDGVPGQGDGTDQDFALVCSNCRREPLFSLDVTPTEREVCAPVLTSFDVTIGSILGFSEPVDLALAGLPASIDGSLTVDPVMPPGSSQAQLDVGADTPTATYPLTLTASAGGLSNTVDLSLTVAAGLPGAATLSTPADGALEVPAVPTFTWSTAPEAATYTIELALDPGFETIVYSASEGTTTHTLVDFVLEPATGYFWRVRAINACGDGTPSAAYGFTTRVTPPILLVDDDDDAPDVREAYTAALDSLSLTWDVWDTVNTDDGEPLASTLAPYRAIVWFSGAATGGLVEPGYAGPGPAGELALGDYLDAGGCVFLSSQNHLRDHGAPGGGPNIFMASYFGLDSGASFASQSIVTGAGEIFEDLGTVPLVYPFANLSDRLSPDITAELAFAGDRGDAALRKDNGLYRTTWWGFPFEALPTEEIRTRAMRLVLEDHCGVAVPLFVDGFESGDTGAWSSTNPGG